MDTLYHTRCQWGLWLIVSKTQSLPLTVSLRASRREHYIRWTDCLLSRIYGGLEDLGKHASDYDS